MNVYVHVCIRKIKITVKVIYTFSPVSGFIIGLGYGLVTTCFHYEEMMITKIIL